MKLRGAHVLLTGASKGIGRCLVDDLAAAGATVALVARSAELIEPLADRVGGSAHPTDLADSAQVAGLIERVEQAGGPVDVLINNAGIENHALIDQLDEAVIEQTTAINFTTPQRLCRQVLPGMIERGRGHIVNVSSSAGVFPVPGLSTYCATKAGLSQFTACLRADLAGTGVGTTLVRLGPVDTAMWDRLMDANTTMRRVSERLETLKISVSVPPEKVSGDIVRAIGSGKRHVMHPKRIVPVYMLGEANRRSTEVLLTGVQPRA